jgi:hypothetical protein
MNRLDLEDVEFHRRSGGIYRLMRRLLSIHRDQCAKPVEDVRRRSGKPAALIRKAAASVAERRNDAFQGNPERNAEALRRPIQEVL